MIYTKAWRMYEDLMVDLAHKAALFGNITTPTGLENVAGKTLPQNNLRSNTLIKITKTLAKLN